MVFSRYATQDINSLHTKKRPIRAFFSDFILFKLFAKSFLRRLQKIAYGFRHSAVCKLLSLLYLFKARYKRYKKRLCFSLIYISSVKFESINCGTFFCTVAHAVYRNLHVVCRGASFYTVVHAYYVKGVCNGARLIFFDAGVFYKPCKELCSRL